jgi:hypothetical protein
MTMTGGVTADQSTSICFVTSADHSREEKRRFWFGTKNCSDLRIDSETGYFVKFDAKMGYYKTKWG